jgi:aspartate/methionine/tyrosine aminotransferase
MPNIFVIYKNIGIEKPLDLRKTRFSTLCGGKKAIFMQIGAPSTGAPEKALTSLEKIEQHNILGYSLPLGIQPLRERIARMYWDEYQLKISPNRIAIAIGASSALLVAALACFDEEATFGIPYPAYPAYETTLQLLGIKTVDISTKPENGFQPTPEDIKNLPTKISSMADIEEAMRRLKKWHN